MPFVICYREQAYNVYFGSVLTDVRENVMGRLTAANIAHYSPDRLLS